MFRDKTPARLGIGHSGARMKTKDFLKLRQDHARAVDAVWSYVDEEKLAKLGFKIVNTLVESKEEYIRRRCV